MTFSDKELEVTSNLDGNIVCRKFAKKLQFSNRCSGSFHITRKSAVSGVYELQQSIDEDFSSDSNPLSQHLPCKQHSHKNARQPHSSKKSRRRPKRAASVCLECTAVRSSKNSLFYDSASESEYKIEINANFERNEGLIFEKRWNRKGTAGQVYFKILTVRYFQIEKT